uniref:Uncharacterized protein n=1 Tax=Arundo donax TaxID=35708 RepID=A0A0A9F9Q9_ARUDO
MVFKASSRRRGAQKSMASPSPC